MIGAILNQVRNARRAELAELAAEAIERAEIESIWTQLHAEPTTDETDDDR